MFVHRGKPDRATDFLSDHRSREDRFYNTHAATPRNAVAALARRLRRLWP